MSKEPKDVQSDEDASLKQIKRNVEYYTSQCSRCKTKMEEEQANFDRMDNERERWEAVLRAVQMLPPKEAREDGV